jgi:hypothetical protein
MAAGPISNPDKDSCTQGNSIPSRSRCSRSFEATAVWRKTGAARGEGAAMRVRTATTRSAPL